MNMEIVTKIGTPLALAALALMLASGLLKAVAKNKKSGPVLKLMVHWVFITALVLGVLANFSYLLVASYGREVRIAGTVHDENDKGLDRAIIDIPGRGRAATREDGTFELTIPDSRTANEYQITVSLPGYESQHLKLKGPRPHDTVDATLKRPVLKAEALIQKPGRLLVSHYLGLPQVDINLMMRDPLPDTVQVEQLSLSVVSPEGKKSTLTGIGTYSTMGNQFGGGPLPMFVLTPNQEFQLGYAFFGPDFTVDYLAQKAQLELNANPNRLPQVGVRMFSEGLVKEFTEFMNSHFFWHEGEWKLVIGCSVGSQPFSREFKFELTPAQIQNMKAVSRYYEFGFGIHVAARLPQFPDASASVNLPIQD